MQGLYRRYPHPAHWRTLRRFRPPTKFDPTIRVTLGLPVVNERAGDTPPQMRARKLRTLGLATEYVAPGGIGFRQAFTGTNGTAITTGNSTDGGDSLAVNGAPTYSTAQAHSGTSSMAVTNPASNISVEPFTAYGSTTDWVLERFFVYLTANPVTNRAYLGQFITNALATSAFVRIMTDGKLSLSDATNSGFGAESATSIALNQWVRIEVAIKPGVGTGQMRWWLFNNADDTTPTETSALFTGLTLGANVDKFRLGIVTSPYPAGAFTVLFDDWAHGLGAGILGPVSSDLRLTTRRTKTLGLATETDAPLAITKVDPIWRALGLATETDAPQVATRQKVKTLGLATETDAARPVVGLKPVADTILFDRKLGEATGGGGVVLPISSDIAVGEYVVLWVACDNTAGTNLPTVSSIFRTSDAAALTFTVVASHDSVSTSAGAATRGFIVVIPSMDVSIPSGGGISLNFSAAPGVNAALAAVFTGATGTVQSGTPNSSSGSFPLATLSTGAGVSVGNLVLALGSCESNAAITALAGSNVEPAGDGAVFTTGGGAAANVSMWCGYNIYNGIDPYAFQVNGSNEGGQTITAMAAGVTYVAYGGTQTRTLGLATETDASLSPTRRKVRTLGLASEADSGLSLTRARARALGLASETDAALAITKVDPILRTLGQASESDTSQAITRQKLRALGQVVETDQGVTVTRQKVRALGLATETDAPLALTRQKIRALGLATETDTPLALTKVDPIWLSIGQASETDTGQAATRRKVKTLGLVGQALPSELTSLALWWVADDIAQADASAVATWSARAGVSLVQATAGQQPTYRTNALNGHAAVRFDGAASPNTDTLNSGTVTNPFTQASGEVTIFAVAKKTAAGGAFGDVLSVSNGTNPDWNGTDRFALMYATSVNKWGMSRAGSDALSPATAVDTWAIIGSYDVAGAVNDDGTATLNGVAGTQSGHGVKNQINGTKIALGSGAAQVDSAQPFAGDIAEVIVFDRLLTAVERARVSTYLSDKYGIAVADDVGGDSALLLTRQKVKTLGLATETDSPLAITKVSRRTLDLPDLSTNDRAQNYETGDNGALLAATSGLAGLDYSVVTYPVSGALEFSDAWAHSGSLSMRAMSGGTAGAAQGRYNFASTSTRYFRWYAKLPVMPSVTSPLWRVRTGTTTVVSVRLTTLGGWQLTDPATALIGSATGNISPAGSLVRVELDMVGTTVTLRVYVGANIEGAVPDATVTGTIAGTAFDNVVEGFIASIANFEMFIDDSATSIISQPGPTRSEFDAPLSMTRQKVKTLGIATESDTPQIITRRKLKALGLVTSAASLTETWTGTDGSLWPASWAADDALVSGTFTTEVRGNRGRQLYLAAGGFGFMGRRRTDVPLQDLNLLIRSERSGVDSRFASVHVRTNGIDAVQFELGVANWNIYNVVSGVKTSIASLSSTAVQDGLDRYIRVQVVGTMARMRVWLTSSTEPTTWDLIGTTSVTQSGGIELSHQTASPVLTGHVYWDDLVASPVDAIPMGKVKQRTLGLATETDAPQAITKVDPIWRAIGQASESDIPQVLTRQKVKALGLASEINASLGITRVFTSTTVAIGLATETDAAQALTRRKTKTLGLATETDAAQSFTRRKIGALGLAGPMNLLSLATADGNSTDYLDEFPTNPQLTTDRSVAHHGERSHRLDVVPGDVVTFGFYSFSSEVVPFELPAGVEQTFGCETWVLSSVDVEARAYLILWGTGGQAGSVGGFGQTTPVFVPAGVWTRLSFQSDDFSFGTDLTGFSVGVEVGYVETTPYALSPGDVLHFDQMALYPGPVPSTWVSPSGGLPVGAPKTLALGIAPETDAAQVLTRRKVLALGLSSETDVAQSFGRQKTRNIGLATEVSAAQSFTRQKLRALGLTTEADAAQALSRRKVRALGIATEVDSPLVITRFKVKTLAIAAETDTALAIIKVDPILRTINLTIETDSAQAATRVKQLALADPIETDLAQAITRRKVKTLGLATEADTAQAITRRKQRALGLAAETGTAQAIARQKVRALGLASETDAAQQITRLKRVTLGLAQETDQAFVIASNVTRVAIGLALEVDSALLLAAVRARTLGIGSELDSAQDLDRGLTLATVTQLGGIGSGSALTAGTTIAVANTTGAIVLAGTTIVICGTWDNINSVTAPTITASAAGGVTPTAGHATSVGSGVTTTAGSGIWHQCFRVKTTSDIAIGATITTLTSNQSAVRRSAIATGYGNATATLRGTVASNASAAGTPSVATAGTALAAGDLVVGCVSGENNAAPVADADTLNGSWSTVASAFTNSGGAATNVTSGIQSKVVSATGVQTYNPTIGVAVDSVACVYGLVPASVRIGYLFFPEEPEAAQSVTRVKVKTLGLATETDTARPFLTKTPIGLSTETDAAQVFTKRHLREIGAALESGAAQTATRRKVKTLGLATETDLAQSISAYAIRTASATLSATATLAAAGTLVAIAAATLAGSGTLQVTATLEVYGAASLSASGTLVVTSETVQYGAADLSASGTLAAAGTVVKTATASLDARGDLNADATRVALATAQLSGESVLAADAIVVRTATVGLIGTGSLAAVGVCVFVATADLVASATLAEGITYVIPQNVPTVVRPGILIVNAERTVGIDSGERTVAVTDPASGVLFASEWP